MSRAGSPIILDSWLYLLPQLNTDVGVTRKELINFHGYRYQLSILALLKESGFILSSTKGEYRLQRPLTDIPFSLLVDCWSLSGSSYIRKLFLQYGDLSVDEVCRLPTFNRTASSTSLEAVGHVIRSLSYTGFVATKQLCIHRYNKAYCSTIIRDLGQLNLVKAIPRKGAVLLKRQNEIKIGDITPIVSNKCQTLGKILLLAKHLPVTDLYK